MSKDFKELLSKNIWHSKEELDEVISVIKDLANMRQNFEAENFKEDQWMWWKNPHCKYVSIRFDMRDGGFILVNDRGARISLDELKAQS